MNQLNYGFPLSSILLRFFLFFLTLLCIVLLLFSSSNYFLIIISLIVILSYFYFGIYFFKKSFNEKRKKILEKMIKIANLKGDETILDLGTGSGFLAIGFAKFLTNGKTYGIDKYNIKNKNLRSKIFDLIKINFLGNSLKNAKLNAKIENVENKCNFISSDITKSINFSDNYFDIVISSQFFYCIPNKKLESVFNEINRVCKKHSKIIIFESKSFRNWNINSVKNYFENKGFDIKIIKKTIFKDIYILYGKT